MGLDGAETTPDGYFVQVEDSLQDPIVRNLIQNGYPYKTVSELSLANESEARYATQFALWIYLNHLDITQIIPMEESYNRVIEAIQTIYQNGTNFFPYQTNGITITEEKKENLLDNLDPQYYSKTYQLDYGENLLEMNFTVQGIHNYVITDELNNPINSIIGHKKIKILFSRKDNQGEIHGTIRVQYRYKENAVLFAKSKVQGMQDVSLTLSPIQENEISVNFSDKPIQTHLIITKKDLHDDTTQIPNVIFHIYDEDDKFLGKFITDKDGKITLQLEKDLNIFNHTIVKIREIQVPDPYIIDDKNHTQTVSITVGGTTYVTFKNDKRIEKIPNIPDEKETPQPITQPKIALPKTGY